MDINIIFFSQTGNTRKVAEAMGIAFEEGGHKVQSLSMKKAKPEDALKGDLLGIGTPTFECQAPRPVKNFLKSLPAMDRRKAFVFATAGGAPGKVLYDVTRLLRKKGSEVIGGFLTRGEIHHPAPCIVGKSPARPNKEDLDKARRFAVAVADHVASDRPGPLPESRPEALKQGKGFYDLVGAITSSDSLIRFLLPEPKLNQSKCDQCKWCVHECPMDNITMQPFPVLGDKCIRCYRCLTGCHTKAFNADWRFSNLVVLALWNEPFMRWFGEYD